MRAPCGLVVLLLACGASPRPPAERGQESSAASLLDAGLSTNDAGVSTNDAGVSTTDAGESADATAPDASASNDTVPALELAAFVRLGRRAYGRVCVSCHEDGPRLVGRALSAVRIRRQVRHGGRRMRAIPTRRLSERELEAIVMYLASTRQSR